MITIDGSQGEGGGQVLRSTLSLAMVTGQPVEISNIRARRPTPGLMPQHLTAVNAAATVCNAEVEGHLLGSQRIRFAPGPIESGSYCFDVTTAGATTLVLQTLWPALSGAAESSELTLIGGTHVPWSPCYHYLAWQWLPYLELLGYRGAVRMERAGFYPRGGGRLTAHIRPRGQAPELTLTERGRMVEIRGVSAVANLPLSIAERQQHQARERLSRRGLEASLEIAELPAVGRGTLLLLLARFERGSGCSFSLGARGIPAERVADQAVDALFNYLDSGAAIDRYLADQLLLPAALTSGPTAFTCERVTQHLLTNAEVLRRFLPVEVQISERGGLGYVRIEAPTGPGRR